MQKLYCYVDETGQDPTSEKTIKSSIREEYRASIYVDGIDQYKAEELTNALRVRGVSLESSRLFPLIAGPIFAKKGQAFAENLLSV